MAEAETDRLVRVQRRVGSLLRGKYHLDAVLDVGSLCCIYAATHGGKKRFAVKILHPELSLHPEIRGRFLREGYAANSVDHPGALPVIDDDVDEDGAAFLVTELLHGESAEDLLARSGGRLPLPAVVAIAHGVLEVLASAHARGVLHRDLKASSLFLTRRRELKVLDFGVARVRDAAASRASEPGAVMGSPGFMAPEQALGKSDDYDAQTDVWGVGALAFYLATGTRVHWGESLQETLVFAATRPAPSLASVLPDAPPAVVDAIDRALAVQKADRWRSATAMREALRDASALSYGGLASLPEPSAGSFPGTPPQAFEVSMQRPLVTRRDLRKRGGVLLAIGVGFGLSVVALAAFHPSRSGVLAARGQPATESPLPSASAYSSATSEGAETQPTTRARRAIASGDSGATESPP
jgi:eukaryotic-like serine/threonine-protein kinase